MSNYLSAPTGAEQRGSNMDLQFGYETGSTETGTDRYDIAQVHEQADGWFARCVPCEWDGRLHYAGRSCSRAVAQGDADSHNLAYHPKAYALIQRNRILWHMIASEDIAEVIEEALRAGDTGLVTKARRALNRRIKQQSR